MLADAKAFATENVRNGSKADAQPNVRNGWKTDIDGPPRNVDAHAMIANAAGHYIDNAIAAVDAEIAGCSDRLLMNIRRELLMMKERRDFLPSYGRFLVDSGLENEKLQQQLLEIIEWRRQALKRKR